MKFWQHQRTAKANTRLLFLLFAVAVLVVSCWMGALVYIFYPQANVNHFIAWSLITLVAILISSIRRSYQLRKSGGELAEEIGATFVGTKAQDKNWLRFRNTAKEMAIASRILPPKLYVLENENTVNAFAMGHTQKDAVIVATSGMLNLLNRDELQGVIAHEIAHIANGDIEINLRLMGLLHGMLVIGRLGETFIDVGTDKFGGFSLSALNHKFDRNAKERTPQNYPQVDNQMLFVPTVVGFFLLFLGFAGLAVGRMVKAAISRQRELLADASAVQFTRQSQSLANALKKMAAIPQGTLLYDQAMAEEFSHMLMMPGQKILSWYDSHPPILERIKRLDPSFNPTKLEFLKRRLEQEHKTMSA